MPVTPIKMDTVTISSPREFSLNDLRAVLSKRWRVESSTPNTIVVHSSHSGRRAYVRVVDPDEHADEFELKHTDGFELQVDYSSVSFVKELVSAIADDRAMIVDNDFGTVLRGDAFAAKCRAQPEWDWRADSIQ